VKAFSLKRRCLSLPSWWQNHKNAGKAALIFSSLFVSNLETVSTTAMVDIFIPDKILMSLAFFDRLVVDSIEKIKSNCLYKGCKYA
jgi:hypothetical protein